MEERGEPVSEYMGETCRLGECDGLNKWSRPTERVSSSSTVLFRGSSFPSDRGRLTDRRTKPDQDSVVVLTSDIDLALS